MAARIAIVSITAYMAVMVSVHTVLGTGVDLERVFSTLAR
jgi:hypothetical protein